MTVVQRAGICSLHDILTAYPQPVADSYDPNELLWSDNKENPQNSNTDGLDGPVGGTDSGSINEPEIEEVTPATPALCKPIAGTSAASKENVAPTPTPKARGPKALQQDASVEKARASLKNVPVKRTPLDMLVSLQECVFNLILCVYLTPG